MHRDAPETEYRCAVQCLDVHDGKQLRRGDGLWALRPPADTAEGDPAPLYSVFLATCSDRFDAHVPDHGWEPMAGKSRMVRNVVMPWSYQNAVDLSVLVFVR